MGAIAYYLSSCFRNSYFIGIDLSSELVKYGNNILKDKNNCQLYQGDWFEPDTCLREKFDGIISFQTLFWLPEYQEPLRNLSELNPKCIAISSLFG